MELEPFLQSFLDSFITTRDRGVEWSYTFSRMATKTFYDSDGNKHTLDPKHKIYLLTNDLPGLTRRTTKDIKPCEVPVPNRRTYGPALSGKFLDRGSTKKLKVNPMQEVATIKKAVTMTIDSASKNSES